MVNKVIVSIFFLFIVGELTIKAQLCTKIPVESIKEFVQKNIDSTAEIQQEIIKGKVGNIKVDSCLFVFYLYGEGEVLNFSCFIPVKKSKKSTTYFRYQSSKIYSYYYGAPSVKSLLFLNTDNDKNEMELCVVFNDM